MACTNGSFCLRHFLEILDVKAVVFLKKNGTFLSKEIVEWRQNQWCDIICKRITEGSIEQAKMLYASCPSCFQRQYLMNVLLHEISE